MRHFIWKYFCLFRLSTYESRMCSTVCSLINFSVIKWRGTRLWGIAILFNHPVRAHLACLIIRIHENSMSGQQMRVSVVLHFLVNQLRWSMFHFMWYNAPIPLQWRNIERDGASNHRRIDCLLNCLFRRKSKKTPKLLFTGKCLYLMTFSCAGIVGVKCLDMLAVLVSSVIRSLK